MGREDKQMTEYAIMVKDVTFSYGAIEAVRGISFQVAPGEILGFLGPNGAGKSTTIKILTGQLTPKSGLAQVLGVDDTPVAAGMAKFDLHRLLIVDASVSTEYKLRIVWGIGTLAAAIIAEQCSEVMIKVYANRS